MKQKKKLLLIVLIFAVLIAGAAILYNTLKNTGREGGLAKTGSSSGQDSGSDTDPDSDSAENKDSGSGSAKDDAGQEKNASLPSAPDFTVQDAAGKDVALSDLFGRPIVLNFWNSNCPPCRQEMPDFEEIHKENPDIRFVMVDTVGANGETLESGKAYIEEEGFTFPVYYDVKMEASTAYQIRAFPTTFLIDSNGKIVSYGEGMLDKETLLTALEDVK